MEFLGNKAGTGLALGKCLILRDSLPNIDKLKRDATENIDDEKNKALSAIKTIIEDYDQVIKDISEGEIKQLTEFYKMMLLSKSLKNNIIKLIEKDNYNAVGAVKVALEEKENQLANVDNPYLKERSQDVKTVKEKVIKKILKIKETNLDNIKEDVILVAKELNPSILLTDNLKYIKGVISEIGGKTSHVAILATSAGIPSVFGIPNIVDKVTEGEILYIDGNKGIVKNELSSECIIDVKEKIKKEKIINKRLDEMIGKKATTKDNKDFKVVANTGELTELKKLDEIDCDGVGLFRTEFLFLNRNTPPNEDELFNVFKSFAEKLKEKPLIIRTLDVGGDKQASYINIEKELNPFMGYRAIRYCLGNKDFFKILLRAILRASSYGNVMIMYPMISSLEEIKEANEVLDEAKEELLKQGFAFNSNIKVGIMVEIPSVAISADLLIDEVDFFSIGTNDLVQYTLAVDRINTKVSNLYTYFNPGVIRLIKMTIDSTKNKPNKFVGMCGEMAADPLGIIVLVGLGLQEFSVNIESVLKVKKLITLLNYEETKEFIFKIMNLKTSTEIEQELKKYAEKVYGEYY